jgi:hypothetical protein
MQMHIKQTNKRNYNYYKVKCTLIIYFSAMNSVSRILSKPLARVYCREITTGFRFQSPLSFDKNSNDGTHKSNGFCACGMCKRGLTVGSDAHKPTGFCACGMCKRGFSSGSDSVSGSEGHNDISKANELEAAIQRNRQLEEELQVWKEKVYDKHRGEKLNFDQIMAEGM